MDENKDLELIVKSDEDVTLVNLLRYDVIKAGQIIQHNSCNGDFAEYEKYVHKMRSMLDFFDIKYKYKTDWGDSSDNYSWYLAELPNHDGLFFIEIISDYDIKCIEIDEVEMFNVINENMSKIKVDNSVNGNYILQNTHTLDGST